MVRRGHAGLMRPGWFAVGAAVVSAAACGAPGTPTARPTPAGSPAPALIQVENIVAARPQAGLSGADVVVEYLTEGGISRFSVLFLHAPSARVGPVRSARLVTITLAQRLGAVLIYSGAGTYVEQQLAGSDVTRFTESTAGGALFRVNGRAAPHNLYTDGTRIAELL